MLRALKIECVLFAVLIAAATSNSQNCLTANNDRGLPDYGSMDAILSLKSAILPLQHQTIIPSYKFQCCGVITEWMLSIAVSDNSTRETLSLQVWRPSPAVEQSGCYNLVGSNNFTAASPQGQLTVVTPAPHERIEFQPGDVLGFFVENVEVGFTDSDGGVMMLCDLEVRGDRGYETEEVWYATNLVFSNVNCLAAVGSGKMLDSSTNVAPIISVSYTLSDHCTNSLSGAAMPVTPTPSTPRGTPVPTLTATQSTISTPLRPPLLGNDLTILVAIAVAAFVVVIIASATIAAVCVKARRRNTDRDKLAMSGSGAYVTPLLDRPVTNQVESTHR